MYKFVCALKSTIENAIMHAEKKINTRAQKQHKTNQDPRPDQTKGNSQEKQTQTKQNLELIQLISCKPCVHRLDSN